MIRFNSDFCSQAPTTQRSSSNVYTTTTQRPSTRGNLLVTIKDFQPQSYKISSRNTHVPVFNEQTVKQSKRPQRLNNFLGIENILQQNNSDTSKIDEIIRKLNQTGSLTRVNVFNTSSRSAVRKSTNFPGVMQSRISYPNVEHDLSDHQKDSKELKVQFVLDCGLKDMASTLKKPLPTSQYQSPLSPLKKLQYPTYPNAAFNQRVTTKSPTRLTYVKNGIVYYVPNKQSVKVTTTTEKPRIVYVDPPIVGEISDTFENVYNYFENAMTTKVRAKSRDRKTARKRPMKRSTVHHSITPPTNSPNYQHKQNIRKGEKLSTKIHVTSEYIGKDPITEPPVNKATASDSEASYSEASFSDESYSDEYDDDDDDDRDDDDDDDYYNLSLGSAGEDDVSVQCAIL